MKASFGAGVVTAWLLLVTGAAQTPGPSLRIVSPEDGTYVSGAVVVRAAISPASQPVERMTFFADGRIVCTVERPPFECEWHAGAGVREHLFRVVAYLPGGGRVAQSVRTKSVEYAEAVDVEVLQVTVTVLDGGRFVRGLARDAFRVYEDDVRQPITYFAAQNIPLELVVGVDISESMTAAIAGVRENVKRFLSALRPTDRITVTAFNENFFVAARPSADLAARLKAVDRLAPWGMTSLHEVIVRSFDLLGTQPGRRGLLLFTDGEDTSSRIPRDAVERRAETSDAVLYLIGQGRAVESPALRSLCESLARKSGGRAMFPRQVEDVRETFDQILDELSNQYLLAYSLSSTARDGAWHRIRVEVGDGRYAVRARQGYRLEPRQPSWTPGPSGR
jgi:Ca-activated chloride channel family protein